MTSPALRKIRRGRLSGTVLRPLGLNFWGAEQADSGITLLGKIARQVPFLEFAGPATLTKVLGFSGVAFPLKGGHKIKVAGVSAAEAADFVLAANEALQRHVARQLEAVEPELRALLDVLGRLERPRRYPAACLVAPFVDRAAALIDAFPESLPVDLLTSEQRDVLDRVLSFRDAPEQAREASINSFIEAELTHMQAFFDTIESNPLSPEQRLAVVTDEDATLVLAGAGSGKTSVIVAKAAYLIERGVRQSEEILLMAFGKDAAAEMAARIQRRSGEKVDALTFHALGYSIIREVEGTAPALAAHASDDAQLRALLRDILINDVARKGGMGGLLLEWFSEFYWPYKSEWDFKTQNEYYEYVEAHELRTLKGERVKSFEELEIANWLYINGIAYAYEPDYEHQLPENNRRAYTPDFRLTETGIYIEHFGVRKSQGSDGSVRLTTAPYVDREHYLEGMAWKRKVHQDHGTTLIETYSYERVEGRLTEALREKLSPYVTPQPLPPDQVLRTLAEMGQVDAFTQTLGTFLRHFKSSGTSIEECQAKAENSEDAPRSRALMDIFDPLLEAYQERLGDRIDFEDMIVRAAQHVETGRYQSPYRHLLVDEFQDISAGRARLLKALKAQHADARIFAVGDDWQSIYRFAGSDIHLMRNFGTEFGGSFAGTKNVHKTVDLGRTFRSVDKIALAARRFVLQNPAQIQKAVIPAGKTASPAIMVAYYHRGQDEAALKVALDELDAKATGKQSVLLLGRYHFLRPRALGNLSASYSKLSIRFTTVHASKGLEADHVVILRAAAEQMGFPSEIVDDPLLDLVLPEPEHFSHAEERRLFYVALTRARTSVTILADREKPSAFVRELMDDPEYQVSQAGEISIAQHQCGACGGRMLPQNSKNGRLYFACEHRLLCGNRLRPCKACGSDLPVKAPLSPDTLVCSCGAAFPACSECSNGWLVERKGRHATFLGCVNYPECKGSRKMPKRHPNNRHINRT